MSKSIASGGIGQLMPSITLASGIVDWSLGNVFSHSISANTTYSYLNNTDGRTAVLKITNTSGSPVTLTWPANTIGTDTTIAASTTKVISLVQVGGNTYCENPTAASGTSSGKQLFTSSGSFTVPAGVTTIYISGCGGGGGGGNGGGNGTFGYGGGGGGGGGSIIAAAYVVTPGQSIGITIGSGGSVGSAGSSTQVGSLVTLNGGGGGQHWNTGGLGGAAGGIGGSPGARLNTGSNAYGGGGGGTHFGSGGQGTNNIPSVGTTAAVGSGYGSGGAGGTGSSLATTNYGTGANGQSGFVLIEW